MARHIINVYTQPVPGREDEWNRWYDDIHIPDRLRYPEVIAVQRFHVSPGHEEAAGSKEKNLCVYELETDDLEELLARLNDPTKMEGTDALDPDSVRIVTYTAFRPRQT